MGSRTSPIFFWGIFALLSNASATRGQESAGFLGLDKIVPIVTEVRGAASGVPAAENLR